MTNIQNTLYPARAHQMHERKSLRSQDSYSFTLTENERALDRSDIIMCALKNDLLSLM